MTKRRVFPESFSARDRALATAIFVAVITFASLSIGLASTAANIIEPSSLSDTSAVKNANDFRPAECSSVTVGADNLKSGGSSVDADDGTGWLLLADPTTASLTGGDGGDCILGNASATISGGNGVDVCIGDVPQMDATCEAKIQA